MIIYLAYKVQCPTCKNEENHKFFPSLEEAEKFKLENPNVQIYTIDLDGEQK